MFFRLCNSPATFQMFMNDTFWIVIIEDLILIYMDDILIFSDNLPDLEWKTKWVLQICADNDLYLNPKKCEFNKEQVEYLGLIISHNTISMDPIKLAGISKWPTPSKVQHIWQFLGFCNWYRQFIHHFSHTMWPLYDLTQNNTKWNWTDECQELFNKLKMAFQEQPVLLIPDPTKPFILETDASKVASGGTLLQTDDNGDYHPCGFISKSFGPAQQRYEIYDQELLAIIRGLDEWRHYLLGSPHQITVWCNHKNLTYFRAARRLSPWQSWWNLTLSLYNLNIIHKQGKSIPGSDALSRQPDHGEEPPEERILLPSTIINSINLGLRDNIIQITKLDSFAQLLIHTLQNNEPLPIKSAFSDWKIDSGIIWFRNRTYIPNNLSLKQAILKLFHDNPTMGHPGKFKTLALLQQQYWWPGMSRFSNNYVAGCALCQQMKINTHPTLPPLHPIPANKNALPFQTVSMDFITDLPPSEGFDSIFVIVDHNVTKGIVLIPCTKNIDGSQTAKLYHDHVFWRFGLPKQIISDRGPQFSSQFFQQLCTKLGIKSKLSTAYHPQSDGQTEQTNQDIEAYLWIYCGNFPRTWTQHITNLEFAHNQQIHSSTKDTPFHLLYGYHPIAIPPVIENTNIPSLSHRLHELNLMWKEAQATHELAHNRMIKKFHSSFTPFKQGQLVWLESQNLRYPTESKKFNPKWEGPFPITKVLSPLTYQLKLPPSWRIHPIFHATLLSPFMNTDTHGPAFSKPPPDQIEGEEEYEVEAIIAHRGNGTRCQYLIKWHDYPTSENTWQKENDLKNAPQLLHQYKNDHKL